MLTTWIIHRDAHHRAALARIAGTGDDTLLGAPADPLFESAGQPAVALLGLSGDYEQELDFVHRHAMRSPRCHWIIMPGSGELAEARRLFDTIEAEFIPYPPSPTVLRRRVRTALQRRPADPLSSRQDRGQLRDRFGRWFADLEMPELIRAIDPRLSGVPILIRGEEGTGRNLLARYIHAFGGRGDERLVHAHCRGMRSAQELAGSLDFEGIESGTPCTLWLEGVDSLPLAAQRQLADWVEFGLPDGGHRAMPVRVIAGAGDERDLDAEPGLDPRLLEAAGGLTIAIPPLRERVACIEAFVADTALAWCRARGERLRRFSPDALTLLRRYPWPGNLHELEAVVVRTLSITGADPLLPVHLRFPMDSTRPQSTGGSGFAEEPILDRRLTGEAEVDEADLPEAVILDEEPADGEPLRLRVERDAPVDDPAGALHDVGGVDEEDDLLDDDDVVEVDDGDPRIGEAIGQVEAADESAAAAQSAAEMAEAAAADTLPDAGRRQMPLSDRGADDDATSAQAGELRRLVRAVAHEVRNPLVSIRTFSELLPDHYDDPEFRQHFRELVSGDVRRIDEAVERLQSMVEAAETKREPVDVAHVLESLLAERTEQIRTRRLLVLKELDHNLPYALGDPGQLREAFAGLLDRALEEVSDRGDIYIASRHHASGSSGAPTVRVLIRCASSATAGEAPQEVASEAVAGRARLDLVMAEAVVKAGGGSLTVDTTDAHETVIVIDLPAPA